MGDIWPEVTVAETDTLADQSRNDSWLRLCWMQATQVVKKARAAWHKANIYGVSECVCFAMNFHCRRSGLHYLRSIHAHGRKSVSAEKQQINFDFNNMCNTQNTCLLSFLLRFSRTRSLTPLLPSITPQWDENVISEMLIILNLLQLCSLWWIYCYFLIWLLTESMIREIFSLWNV